MPYGTSPAARQLEHGKFNRFLAALPPHDFSLLAPHLRMIALERGTMLHDVGDDLEHVYFPHTGMVSLVAVMQSGATVETATVGRGGVVGASAGLGARRTFGRAGVQLPGTAGGGRSGASERGGHSAERSFSCRAGRRGFQRPDFMRLPVKAEPFAISSC